VDFTRDIHAITLFGCGFGEIIRPADVCLCSHWDRLPEQREYLAASVSNLKEIMANHSGDKDMYPVCLTNTIVWHNPDRVFESRHCMKERQEEHSDFTQVLLPQTFQKRLSQNNSPVLLHGHGTVVFGHNKKFGWFWNDTGDPKEREILSLSESEIHSAESGVGGCMTSSS
jgi:hypothetical protein